MSALPPDEPPPNEPSSDSPSEEVPKLDPEFAEALRDAKEQPPAGAEPAGEDQPREEPAGEEESPAEVEPAGEDQPPADEQPPAEAGPSDTVEYAIEEPTDERPVPTVAIGAGAHEAREAVAAASQTGRPWAPSRPPAPGDPEAPPRRKRHWLRFTLGSLLIVASIAGATATSILLYLSDFANALRGSQIKGVKNILDSVDGGAPQTILIVGSDRRAATAGDDRGLSDTTILLRLDPDQSRVALMSIPRDLKVNIPGYGTNKFNAAYAFGGPKLTLKTIKKITGGLDINHLVNVDFRGFARAVDEINCVYVDVDRRYFHSNLGLPAELQYDEIDIRPGYQKLCGIDALDYVRYRHTDTDLVRAARQQDFLREARQAVPATKLFSDRHDLIKIFTTYTTSDINDVPDLIDVMELLIESRNAPILEIHFPAVLGPSYVYASKPAIRRAVDQFLGFEASGGPRGELDLEGESRRPRDGRRGKRSKGPKRSLAPTPQSDGLVDAAQGSRDVAKTVARKVGADFPVFFPRRLPSGSLYVSNEDVSNPYVYNLRDTGDESHGAYKMVLQIPQGDYFGLQGIRGWQDPPVLSDPSESRTVDGRRYDIYLDGDRVRLIAWREAGNSYWISNSLLQTLTNDQMLGMARSVGEITPNPKPKPGRGKRRKR